MKTRNLADAATQATTRLKPMIEQRSKFVGASLKHPTGWKLAPYIVGHGQQIARRDLGQRIEALSETYAGLTQSGPSRQNRRRDEHRAKKAEERLLRAAKAASFVQAHRSAARLAAQARKAA